MVAHGVTSLPVPAVVGTAMSVLWRVATKGRSPASPATRSAKRPPSSATISAFAVSMALPPPTATITSTSACVRQNHS
ncbi:hypothetical protein D9M68_492730 [compost metagenome]